ncbi:MAG: S-layer homology domain-containing protein [Actinomycetota bacterium]
MNVSFAPVRSIDRTRTLRVNLLARLALIAAVIAATVSLAPAPAGAYGGFSDVEEGRYYADAVAWMTNEGITTGISPGCFGPDELATRGQVVTFLWRYVDPNPTGGHSFTDVTASYQQAPVSWAASTGVTTGLTSTLFGPNNPATRAQVVTFLWRIAGEPTAGIPGHGFSDVTAGWQQAAISWAKHAGVVTGRTDSTFDPDTPVTRAEFAAILWRFDGQPQVTPIPDTTCGGSTPSLDGFPTASTTGIAGVGLSPGDLTPSGTITITQDGAVIDMLDVSGVIKVQADNVTIRRTRIRHSSGFGIRNEGRNLVVEDTTIIGSTTDAQSAIAYTHYRCTRCNMSGAVDGATAYANVVIEDSYIHNLRKGPGTHNDGIQGSGGSNVTIQGNTILGPYQTSTSAILAQTNVAPIDNWKILDNYLHGGSYTVYLRDKGNGNGSPTNSIISGNVFVASTSGVFAACLQYKSAFECNTLDNTISASGGVTITNNVFDNGRPVE